MKVSLFVTCLTDTFYPRSGIAVVKVLERLGCEVDFPLAQTCCGQPMYNNGFHHECKAVARHMIDTFESADYVVTPSGSCAAMIHDYYGDLLQDDPAYHARALKLIEKTYEFTQFLRSVLRADLKKLGVKWPGKVTYHYSCHLRGIGVKWPVYASHDAVPFRAGSSLPTDPGLKPTASTGLTIGACEDPDPPGDGFDLVGSFLRQIDGLEYIPLEKADQCCGFGGTFAAKYPQMSGAMVADKVQCIEKTGASVVVSNEGGCTMNIAGMCHRKGTCVRFISLPEIIAEGLGLIPKEENSKDQTPMTK